MHAWSAPLDGGADHVQIPAFLPSSRHSRARHVVSRPHHAYPASHPSHSRVGGNLNAPSTVNSTTPKTTPDRCAVAQTLPSMTPPDADREIPAYAGMTE